MATSPGATQMHPLWWVIFPALAAFAFVEATSYVVTGEVGQWASDTRVRRPGVALLAALILVWCARFLGAFGGPVAVD